MPGPLTSSRRRARRWCGVAVVVLALVAGVGSAGCTNGSDAGASASVTASPPAGRASPAPIDPAAASDETVTAVGDLLRRRAAAVVHGDTTSFADTVADPAAAAGRRQLDSFAAARTLRVSRLEVAVPTVDLGTIDPVGSTPSTSSPGVPGSAGSDGVSGSTSTGSPGVPGSAGSDGLSARAEVDVRYRVDGLDRGDRVARLQYDLVRSGKEWQVAAERPVGPGATAPWVAMPTLRVARGEHGVVAGTVPGSRLREHLRVVDREVPRLRTQWKDTPGRVLVLAPASAAEADLLLGRTSTAGGSPVAASTEGPTGATGRATGDRVVLDPTAFARLTASGRDVVLTHELAHVAVRSTVPGRPASWLAEGYADHVGYARANVSTRRLLAPLVSAMRTGSGPSSLPSTADLQPAGGDIEVPYLAAWQAVELVADRYGEGALRRLVAAGASTGSDADAEHATDRALHSVLGTTRAELTDAWLTRLGHYATSG